MISLDAASERHSALEVTSMSNSSPWDLGFQLSDYLVAAH